MLRQRVRKPRHLLQRKLKDGPVHEGRLGPVVRYDHAGPAECVPALPADFLRYALVGEPIMKSARLSSQARCRASCTLVNASGAWRTSARTASRGDSRTIAACDCRRTGQILSKN